MRHLEIDHHPRDLPDSDLLVPPEAEIDTDYAYGNKINRLVFVRRNWCGLALSLMVHSALLLAIWLLPKPAILQGQTSLAVTLVGGGGLSEGLPEPGGAGSVGNGSPPGETAVVASAPDRERQIVREEIPEGPVPPTKTASLPDRKPRRDTAKKRPQTTDRSIRSDSASTEAGMMETSNSIDRVGGNSQGRATQGGVGTSGQGGGSPGATGMGSEGGNGGNGPLATRFGSPDGPRFLKRAWPVYPESARRIEKEGQVVLQLTIDERGSLVAIELVKKAGFGFDEEAMKALRQSTFCPAQKDGKPVVCKVILPVKFVLKSGDDF
ncbi:MAG: TonB family protein [Syntrophobacteraceae bacterium]